MQVVGPPALEQRVTASATLGCFECIRNTCKSMIVLSPVPFAVVLRKGGACALNCILRSEVYVQPHLQLYSILRMQFSELLCP